MPKSKRRLYVAYGSNMNVEQMERRCPTAKVVGVTYLRNWRLLFWGVATIDRYKGGKVPVVVWDIKPKDEDALDVYEGWPRMYRKESVRVTLNGKQVRAFVYIMNNGHPQPPGNGYFKTIRQGYISAGFNVAILREAAEKSRKKEKNVMDKTIKNQIMAVRATGEVNMFDTNGVQQIANREGFYELVCFIEDNKRAYSRFILSGDTEEDME